MIRRGDRVRILPQWQDDGDADIVFTATEDEDGGRVPIRAELGLALNPVQVVGTEMIELFQVTPVRQA